MSMSYVSTLSTQAVKIAGNNVETCQAFPIQLTHIYIYLLALSEKIFKIYTYLLLSRNRWSNISKSFCLSAPVFLLLL